MTTKIPDFDVNELAIIRSALKNRYGREIEIQLADSEVQLEPNSAEITHYPTVFWQVAAVSFVILKLASAHYRCLFLYGDDQQYGTGVEDYYDIATCVTQLLQAQADHDVQNHLSS